MSGKDEDEGYIVEYVSVGNALKVTAIDPISAREASIVGDPKVGRKTLAKLAIQKLHYVLKKDS